MKLLTLNRLKLAALLSSLLVGTSLLSGCAGMMHQLGYQPMQTPSTQACANAPVLITNLTKDAHHRHYQLNDGRECPEVNYYEQAKLQAERVASRNRL